MPYRRQTHPPLAYPQNTGVTTYQDPLAPLRIQAPGMPPPPGMHFIPMTTQNDPNLHYGAGQVHQATSHHFQQLNLAQQAPNPNFQQFPPSQQFHQVQQFPPAQQVPPPPLRQLSLPQNLPSPQQPSKSRSKHKTRHHSDAMEENEEFYNTYVKNDKNAGTGASLKGGSAAFVPGNQAHGGKM